MNYIEKIKVLLGKELKIENPIYGGLLDKFVLLVLTVGVKCTNEDVHNARSAWLCKTQSQYRLLVPFDKLTKEVQNFNEPYRQAVQAVAKKLKYTI